MAQNGGPLVVGDQMGALDDLGVAVLAGVVQELRQRRRVERQKPIQPAERSRDFLDV
jgi:hypothetical protein